MFYPDYQGVDRDATQRRFEEAWGTPARPEPRPDRHRDHRVGAASPTACAGCTCSARTRSCPTRTSTRCARRSSALDFLVVQDIFLTETAEFADVILPATSYLEKDGTYTNTDRRVQLGRKVMDPPGEARADWEIVQDIARRIGLDWDYSSPSEVFDEMVALMPSLHEPRATTTSACPGSSTPTPTRSTPTARSSCSTRSSTPTTGWRTWCPRSGCRPRSCPTPSTRWCSTPAGCWSTGTPDR